MLTIAALPFLPLSERVHDIGILIGDDILQVFNLGHYLLQYLLLLLTYLYLVCVQLHILLDQLRLLKSDLLGYQSSIFRYDLNAFLLKYTQPFGQIILSNS